jgi:hypothetical protein
MKALSSALGEQRISTEYSHTFWRYQMGKDTRAKFCAQTRSRQSSAAIWNRLLATMVIIFSDNVARVTDLFHSDPDHIWQFGSVMNLSANRPRVVSIADRQLDTPLFVDHVKWMEFFSLIQCVYKMGLC